MKMPPKKESSGDKNKSNANLKIRLIREYNKNIKKFLQKKYIFFIKFFFLLYSRISRSSSNSGSKSSRSSKSF